MDKELLLSDVSIYIIATLHFAPRMKIPRFALESEVIFFLWQFFTPFPRVELSLECCQKLSLSHHPPAVAKTLTDMSIAFQFFNNLP